MNWILIVVGGAAGLLCGANACVLSNIMLYDHMCCQWKCLGIGCVVTCILLLGLREIVASAREFALAGSAGLMLPFLFQSLILFLL